MIFDQDGENNGRWRQGEIIPVYYWADPSFVSFNAGSASKAMMQNFSMIELWADLNFVWSGISGSKPLFTPDGEFTIAILSEQDFVVRHGSLFVAWAQIWWAQYIYDAYQVFNSSRLITADSPINKFRRIGLHECVHNIGFDHSTHPDSIMTNNPYKSTKYQGLLRRPDIIDIDMVYGLGNRSAQGNIIGHICADEDLTFYIPSIEHPATGDEHAVEMHHSTINNEHYLDITSAVPATDGVQFEERAHVDHSGGVAKLIFDECYWLGQRYGRLVFQAETEERYRLIESEE